MDRVVHSMWGAGWSGPNRCGEAVAQAPDRGRGCRRRPRGRPGRGRPPRSNRDRSRSGGERRARRSSSPPGSRSPGAAELGRVRSGQWDAGRSILKPPGGFSKLIGFCELPGDRIFELCRSSNCRRCGSIGDRCLGSWYGAASPAEIGSLGVFGSQICAPTPKRIFEPDRKGIFVPSG